MLQLQRMLPAPPGAEHPTRDLITLLRGTAPVGAAPPGSSRPMWASRRVSEGEVLVHQGSRAQVCLVLLHGCLKRTATMEDGFEQVLSVALGGELLGFETLHQCAHPATITALRSGEVCALPFGDLMAAQSQYPSVTHALNRSLGKQLTCAAETAHMTAAVAGETRVARFLLWWSSRTGQAGAWARSLELCLGRKDIASLLGVAHETVSRSLSALVEAGCLTVDNRHVEILAPSVLLDRARVTRGQGAGGAGRQAAWAADIPPRNVWPPIASAH